jgi:hypothetical protein
MKSQSPLIPGDLSLKGFIRRFYDNVRRYLTGEGKGINCNPKIKSPPMLHRGAFRNKKADD